MWRLLLMPCFVQIVNLSARLVPFITCPVHPVSSIVNLSYDLDCLRLVRLNIFSLFWTLCMISHMLFCVSALSCATKLVEALILLGQENPLVLVPKLRWVGFWSLDLSDRFPPMFGPDCGYSPLVSRRVSAKSWNNMSTIITCIMCYKIYTKKCKPSNKKENCVFRHNSKRAIKWNCERPKKSSG